MQEVACNSSNLTVMLLVGGGLWRVEVWNRDRTVKLLQRSYQMGQEQEARAEYNAWINLKALPNDS